MNAERPYVGIDVAKAHLDIAVRPDDKEWSVTNDEEGIGTLVSQLQELGPARVVLEATGGLELAVTGALAAAELPVVVVNPRQVREFARATGPLGKDRPPGRADDCSLWRGNQTYAAPPARR